MVSSSIEIGACYDARRLPSHKAVGRIAIIDGIALKKLQRLIVHSLKAKRTKDEPFKNAHLMNRKDKKPHKTRK